MSGQAFDLYVLSGVVDDLNVAAGSAYASYGMAAGFAGLLNELRRLGLPFNALIFDRDAEVVVSKSLNPLKSDDEVLGDLETTAKKEIEKASTMVDVILERAQKKAVDEQLLRDDLNNQVDQSFDELVTLCGLPVGCRSADREKPECWPVVQAGQCGFGVEVQNTGTASQPNLQAKVVGFSPVANVSDASQALLELQKAEAAAFESDVALSTYRNVTNQMLATNDCARPRAQGAQAGRRRGRGQGHGPLERASGSRRASDSPRSTPGTTTSRRRACGPMSRARPPRRTSTTRVATTRPRTSATCASSRV